MPDFVRGTNLYFNCSSPTSNLTVRASPRPGTRMTEKTGPTWPSSRVETSGPHKCFYWKWRHEIGWRDYKIASILTLKLLDFSNDIFLSRAFRNVSSLLLKNFSMLTIANKFMISYQHNLLEFNFSVYMFYCIFYYMPENTTFLVIQSTSFVSRVIQMCHNIQISLNKLIFAFFILE